MEIKKNNNNYCVILAGGKGRRLWPSSRMERPKQFLDFFGTGRSLLQQTYDRVRMMMPADHIYISTTHEFVELVRQQLPDVPAINVLPEPLNRNTAPAVAWAGRRIHRENADARVMVTPADQLIMNDEKYVEEVESGLDFVAENDIILTMGVKPTRPEPGYGYIQMGEPSLASGISKVQSFTEKPEREFATIFMESGEFLWNTGIYMTNVLHLRKWCQQHLPDMPKRLADLPQGYTLEDEERMVNESYSYYPNLSMDKAALEMSENVYVVNCHFGWADIGTWHALHECLKKTEDDNVVLDSEVIMEDCKNNIVCLPKGHVGVINGLDGYIVAEQGEVLLICKKSDSSALIRKYVNEVEMKYGDSFV